MSAILLLFILFCFIIFSAILSASETSFFSLSTFTINNYKHSLNKRKKLIAKMLSRPRDLLVTILMLNILSNILIQNTVSSLFNKYTSWILKVGVPLILTLFLGEIIPKSIALPNNKFIANKTAYFIHFISKIIKPIRIILTKITGYISRLMFFFLKKEKPLEIKELQHVIAKSEETDILTHEEIDLINGYLNLHNTSIKEHMKPREKILFYDINTPIQNLCNFFINQQCSRIPVCNKNIDNLLGLVSLKRFFLYKNEIKSGKDLYKYLKKPFFVAETMKAWSLLLELRQLRENIAIVVDEYGSIKGLITQEDLTQQVIGKISDKKDTNVKYTFSTQNELVASGQMEIDELEKIFNIRLERKSNVVTIGGFLIDELGDLPAAGTKIRKNNLLFYVLSSAPNRVRSVYIRLLKPIKKRKRK